MKLLTTLVTVALSLVTIATAFETGLIGDAPLAVPLQNTYRLRHATREKISAGRIRKARDLTRRQLPGPSAVAGPCGTTVGSIFIVRVATRNTGLGSSYPVTKPGCLFGVINIADPEASMPLQVSSNIARAIVYTLDESNGCALTDVTLGFWAVQSSFAAATSLGSVTVEGTDAALEPTGRDCRKDICDSNNGGLTCRLEGQILSSFAYGIYTSSGEKVRNAKQGTCGLNPFLDMQIISIRPGQWCHSLHPEQRRRPLR